MPIPAGPDAPPLSSGWLRFVDSVSLSATVRLDLDDRSPWSMQVGTRFDPPPLDRVTVRSMLADGGIIPASAFGLRTIQLVLKMAKQEPADVAAAHLQTLLRELDRPTNVLAYQPGTSSPVFFRTFRAAPEAVDWDAVQRLLRVDVLAEPFALGVKETLSAATVSNDPAGGMFFDVTGVKGDVETPLYLAVAKAPLIPGGARVKSAIAVRRRGTPSAAPFVLQAESMTANPTGGVTDTSSGPGGAGQLSASGTVRVTSFASATTLQSRLRADPFPATPSVDVRGTYRVFGRVRSTDTSSVYTIGLQWGGDGYAINNSVVSLAPVSAGWRYVDLGLVQMPAGLDGCGDGPTGVQDPVAGIRVTLRAGRTSGGGSLEWDAVLFLPADDRQLWLEWPDSAGTGLVDFVVDSACEAVYGRDSSGARYTTQIVRPEGMFPLVSPGQTNRVYFVRDISGWKNTTLNDDLTVSTSISAWYWPRYLHVRPVAS